MKYKYIFLLLLALFTLFVYLGLHSCRPVRKTEESKTLASDSAALKKQSSGQVVKNDSVGKKEQSTGKKQESSTTSEGGVTVKFKGDTAKHSAPVTIKQNEDGSVTVDAGGRAIDQVKVRNKRRETKKDSTGATTREKVKELNIDSAYHNTLDSNGLSKKEQSSSTEVKKGSPIPWYAWLAGIIVAGAIVLIILKRK